MIFGAKFEQKKQELKSQVEAGIETISVDPKLMLFCMESTEKSVQDYDDLTRKPSGYEREAMRQTIEQLISQNAKLQERLDADVGPIVRENEMLKVQNQTLTTLVEREKRKL